MYGYCQEKIDVGHSWDKHVIRSDVSRWAGAFYAPWLIGGGSARMGYLFQASVIWKGRDLTSVSR